jgi:hypothetical protein
MQVQRVEVQHQRWCRCRGGAEVVQKWNIGGTTEVEKRWCRCRGGAEVVQKWNIGGTTEVEKRWCWCRGAEVGQRCRGAEVCDVWIGSGYCSGGGAPGADAEVVHLVQRWNKGKQRGGAGAEVEMRKCAEVLRWVGEEIQGSAEVVKRLCRGVVQRWYRYSRVGPEVV